MSATAKAIVELYNGYQAKDRTMFRKSAMLYSARNAAPSNRKTLEAMVDTAIKTLQESGIKYWWNALRLAKQLVTQVEESDDKKAIRFFPCIDVPNRNVSFIWRIYLTPHPGKIEEIAVFNVEYKDRILVKLVPVTSAKKSENDEEQEDL